MEDNENIDKHLKESLGNFSVQPKITSFDAVLQKLERKKKRRFLIWFVFPGLLIVTGLFVFIKPLIFSEIAYSEKIKTPNNESISEVKRESEPLHIHQKTGVRKKEITKTDVTDIAPQKSKGNINSINRNEKVNEESSPDKSIEQKNTVNTYIPDQSNGFISATTITPVQDTTVLVLPERLNMQELSLPVNERLVSLPVILNAYSLNSDKNLSTEEKSKKKVRYLIGINIDPQFNTYQLTANENRNKLFDNNRGEPFSEVYLDNKRKQNDVTLNLSYGLKLGVVVKEKWEFLLGFGFQKFKEDENVSVLIDSTNTPQPNTQVITMQGSNLADKKNTDGSYENTFKYFYYSVEAARYFSISRFTKAKAGLGLNVNQLRSANTIIVTAPNKYDFVYSRGYPLNHVMYTANLKIGFIQDLGSKIQFQFCPNLFYGLNSLHNKNYVITQRPYGVRLECLLLFKL